MNKKDKKTNKNNRKAKIMCLIFGIIAIISGIIIFGIIYNNYQKSKEFINNSNEIEATVYNVRKTSKNKYSFEYKYIVGTNVYRAYAKSIKRDDVLKDGDTITIYYDKKNNKDNVLEKPSISELYIGIGILIVLSAIGIIDIIKYTKK